MNEEKSGIEPRIKKMANLVHTGLEEKSVEINADNAEDFMEGVFLGAYATGLISEKELNSYEFDSSISGLDGQLIEIYFKVMGSLHSVRLKKDGYWDEGKLCS